MEAIIFDYGGVLCFHPSDDKVNALAELCGVKPDEFLKHYWADRVEYDRGNFSPREYWSRFASAVGRSYSDEQVSEFRKRDVDFWSSLDDRMIRWIRDLRTGGIKVGLISNLPQDLGEYLRHHSSLFPLFDHVTLSYEQRCVKPDSPIYLECCRGLGVAPSEALFLDDREPNVRGAEAAGLHSVVFETPEQLTTLLASRADELLPFGTPPIVLG